jgi:hypothetical protein
MIAVAVIYSDLVDAIGMENEEGLEDRSGIDT